MLQICVIFLLSSAIQYAEAAFSNFRAINPVCVDYTDVLNPKFMQTARSCNNVFPNEKCAELYGPSKDDYMTGRPPKCENGSYSVNEIVSSCASHCAMCCLVDDYKCSNAKVPKIRCDDISPAQCLDPLWRQILADNCPAVCGFCMLKGCIDQSLDCGNDKTICKAEGMYDFVVDNCARTCGFCGEAQNSTTSSYTGGKNGNKGGTGRLRDAHPNCALWKSNGFCTSPLYVDSVKTQFCAASCSSSK